MSMRTSPMSLISAPLVGSDEIPFAASPGVATIGSIAERSTVCTPPLYSAPGSGATICERSRTGSIPGRCATIQSTVDSSPSNTPALAEHSVAMLAMVARSSGESDESPGPPNSITRSSVFPGFAYSLRMKSITSFAVTPGRSAPVNSKRIDAGVSMKVRPE